MRNWITALVIMGSLVVCGVASANYITPHVPKPATTSTNYEDGSSVLITRITTPGNRTRVVRIQGCFNPRMGCEGGITAKVVR